MLGITFETVNNQVTIAIPTPTINECSGVLGEKPYQIAQPVTAQLIMKEIPTVLLMFFQTYQAMNATIGPPIQMSEG